MKRTSLILTCCLLISFCNMAQNSIHSVMPIPSNVTFAMAGPMHEMEPLKMASATKNLKSKKTSSFGSSLYKPFKVDITTGYAGLTGSDADISFGFNFSVEPKYNITDNVAVGFKIDAAAFVFADMDEDISSFLLMRSYSLTGEYLVGTKKVRPYVGLGIGLYQPSVYITDMDDEEFTTTFDNRIGFAPRAGVHLGHFRIGAEFNLVKDSDLDVSWNHFSLKIGATIGGGKR